MTGSHDRRGFLRGLARLPLIGGGVSILGNPTAAAVPVTREMLESNGTWLHLERRHLMQEMHGRDVVYWHPNSPGGVHFWRSHGQPEMPASSTRAAVILSAAGVPLT